MKGAYDLRERKSSRTVRFFTFLAAAAILLLTAAAIRQAYFLWIAD